MFPSRWIQHDWIGQNLIMIPRLRHPRHLKVRNVNTFPWNVCKSDLKRDFLTLEWFVGMLKFGHNSEIWSTLFWFANKYMLSTILRCKTHRTSCILLLVVIRPTLLNILSFLQQVFLIPDYWLNFDVKQEMEEKSIWNECFLSFFS